ncbi:MAG: thiamine-phosphate kinase [Gemmatimonadota bacterium]
MSVLETNIPMGAGAEFDAIRRLLAVWGSQATGIGDDAAVVDIPPGERLVASTDACVENVHFRRGWLSAQEIGGRAAAAALSDLAAMGATPRGVLVAMALPIAWRPEIEALARGIGDVAASVGCPIIGGNITTATELSLTLSVLGSAARPVSRAGAQPGDIIFVTGRLGGPGAALDELRRGGTPAPGHRARFAAPLPRIHEGLWLAARGAHAAIDISDGLAADAAHLARASGVSLSIRAEALPCVNGVTMTDALRSGEEYELLVTMPAGFGSTTEFEQLFGIPLTAIGTVTAAADGDITYSGTAQITHGKGFDHLA